MLLKQLWQPNVQNYFDMVSKFLLVRDEVKIVGKQILGLWTTKSGFRSKAD
jgi:hypothetical protein